MISKSFRVARLIFLTGFLLSSAVWAATCSKASLRGTYGFLHDGTDVNGAPASAAVTQLTFEPTTGTFTGQTTSSRAGVITTFAVTGTYTVDSNCTGLGLPMGHNPFSFVVTSNGFLAVEPLSQVTGVTSYGFAVNQGSPTCTAAEVAGSFGLETTGILLAGASGTGPLSVIGELKLMVNPWGKGVIRGHVAGSEGGTITFAEDPVTGSFTVGKDCSGTATIKPEGHPAMHFSLVVVRGGEKILAIRNDAGAVVSGTFVKGN